MLQEPYQPQKVNAAELNGDSPEISRLMPPYIKEAQPKTWAYNVVRDWFFKGLDEFPATAKEGVDHLLAVRHMSAVLRSFKYPFEHKMQAAEALMVAWFNPPTV